MSPVTDDDHKRRARRRLIGAVALTIVAVVILPLVLEDQPPPAGPLEVRMPPAVATVQQPAQNTVEFAPPPATTMVAPAEPEKLGPATTPARQESGSAPQPVAKPAPAKPVEPTNKAVKAEQKAAAYTVQVGVFADKSNVQKLQSRISALGFKAYTDELDGSTRVRVGSFPTKAEAEKAATKLSAVGMTGKVVEK